MSTGRSVINLFSNVKRYFALVCHTPYHDTQHMHAVREKPDVRSQACFPSLKSTSKSSVGFATPSSLYSRSVPMLFLALGCLYSYTNAYVVGDFALLQLRLLPLFAAPVLASHDTSICVSNFLSRSVALLDGTRANAKCPWHHSSHIDRRILSPCRSLSTRTRCRSFWDA